MDHALSRPSGIIRAICSPRSPASRRAKGSRKMASARSVSCARYTATHRAVSEILRINGSRSDCTFGSATEDFGYFNESTSVTQLKRLLEVWGQQGRLSGGYAIPSATVDINMHHTHLTTDSLPFYHTSDGP